MKPSISIIVPTYNRKAQLEKCILSIFSQNFGKNKFEIIVVDDGSGESAESAIKKLCNEDNNQIQVQYFYIKEAGRSAARNFGASKANSDLLVFMDDDCTAERNFLSSIESFFNAHPDAAACSNKYGIEYEGSALKFPPAKGTEKQLFYSYFERLLAASNLAVRKKAFIEVGGFTENNEIAEDSDLAMKLLGKGFEVWSLPSMKVTTFEKFDLLQIFRKHFYAAMKDSNIAKKYYKKIVIYSPFFEMKFMADFPFPKILRLGYIEAYLAVLIASALIANYSALVLLPLLFLAISLIKRKSAKACFEAFMLLLATETGYFLGGIVASAKYRLIKL